MEEVIEVYRSCGNVFADMGLPDAEEMLVKAQLSIQIHDIISKDSGKPIGALSPHIF